MRSGTPAVPGDVNFQHTPPFCFTAFVSFSSIIFSRMDSPIFRGFDTLRQSFTNLIYIEKFFTFFLACVKTVYECLKVSFALFSVDFYFFYDALNIQMTVKILLNQENQTLFEVQVSILQKLFSSFCTQPVPKQNRNLMCCG